MMFEKFITRLAYILFGIIVFMAISNTARANDAFIYYNSNQTGAEYSRLKSHYESLGFTVTGSTSTTVSSSDISGKDLVIDIAGTSNCGSTCRTNYDNYVSGGGKLIIAAPYGATNRQGNIESLIENKMSVGTMTYYTGTCSTDLCWQSYKRSGYTTSGVTDYLPGAGQLFSATGGTAMASNTSTSTWHTWYKWDYGSNGGTIIVAMGYDQFQTNLTYTSSMTSFLTEIAEDEGLYSSTPTYSSSISSAQQTTVNNTRNITSNGNAIYIDQTGDNLDLDIVQYDNDNLVAGTATTSSTVADAVISGDDNTISITQGNNAGSTSDDNVVLMGVNGNNNNLNIRQGDNVDDTGGARLIVDVTGNYNTIGTVQENDGGVGNTGHFMSIDVDGNSNIMYQYQRDDGDKIMFVDINGSSNDIDLVQQGTGDHFLDVTAGSNQTIDVNQDGSGKMSATINMSGYSSTLDLDQTGSTAQTYSLSQTCTNTNGCGTTTITQN